MTFERNLNYATALGCSYPKANRAKQFSVRHDNRERRMAAIMRNIVRNEGTFVP